MRRCLSLSLHTAVRYDQLVIGSGNKKRTTFLPNRKYDNDKQIQIPFQLGKSAPHEQNETNNSKQQQQQSLAAAPAISCSIIFQ